MTKRILAQHLIEKMRTRTGLSTTENKKIVETFLDMVIETIAKGNDVQIQNFGTFRYVTRDNVPTRNIVSGEALEPISTAFTTFKSSPYFKDKIKENIDNVARDSNESKSSNSKKKAVAVKVSTAKPTTTGAKKTTAKKVSTAKTTSAGTKKTTAKATSTTKPTTAGAKKTTAKTASTAKPTTAGAKKTTAKKTTTAKTTSAEAQKTTPKKKFKRINKK